MLFAKLKTEELRNVKTAENVLVRIYLFKNNSICLGESDAPCIETYFSYRACSLCFGLCS